MKLTKKIVFVILMLCVLLSLILFLLFRLILYDNLKEQKSKFIRRVVAGISSIFEKETERILTFTADWAVWDTMYDYVSNPTPEIERNMSLSLSVRDGDFSLLVAVGQNRQIVRTEAYSHFKKQPLRFARLAQNKGDIWKFLIQTFDSEESLSGIVQSEFGPIIVVSSPIFHSDLSGPQNGRLLFGRLIDTTFEERISKVIYEKVLLLMGQQYRKKKGKFKQGKPFVEEKENVMIIDYPVTDAWNRHLFTVRVDIQKHTFRIFENAIRLFFIVLITGILLMGVILYFILNRLVVGRIKRISSTTTHVISLDHLSQRIKINEPYNDEITQLSLNINEMLKRLETEKVTKEEVEHIAMMNEKLIFLGRVSANVTHEINNPLFAIANSIRYIKKHLPVGIENTRLSEIFLVVERELDRVKTIAQNIHKFAIPRMEKTKLSDITTIMDAAIKVIKWSKPLIQTTIKYSKKDRHFPLYCNPEALQQVFINIILNSIDAMEGKGRLMIDVLEKADIYRIDFIDNGPGFNDNIKNRVFEPFRSSKFGKGVGLGLNISYNIIRNHGGAIILDDNFHEGAHLIINIPKGGTRNDG